MRTRTRYKTVRRAEVPALFARLQRATKLTVEAATKPELRKVSPVDGSVCPWWTEYKAGRLLKLANPRCLSHWRYINAVNNQRLRLGMEPDFVPGRRAWGHRLTDEGVKALTEDAKQQGIEVNIPAVFSCVGHVKGGELKLYLELKIEASGPYSYILVNETGDEYEELDRAEVERYLPARRDPAEGQGLPEGQGIILRDYSLESLRRIRCTFAKRRDGARFKWKEVYTVID